jgi:hypothetical protein
MLKLNPPPQLSDISPVVDDLPKLGESAIKTLVSDRNPVGLCRNNVSGQV